MKRDHRDQSRRVATKSAIMTRTAATAKAIGSWTTNPSNPVGAMAPNKIYHGMGLSRCSSLIGDHGVDDSRALAGALARTARAVETKMLPHNGQRILFPAETCGTCNSPEQCSQMIRTLMVGLWHAAIVC